MITKFLKQKGFSLTEIMIGMAMMGGVGLLISKQMSDVNKSQNRNDYMSIVNQISGEIQTNLSDRYSCAMTLQGINVGDTIPAIKVGEADPSDRNKAIAPTDPRKKPILFENDKEIRKTGVEIGDLKLITRGGQDLIQVTFDPGLRAKMTGDKPVIKEFAVTGEKTDGKYISCYAERTDSVAVIRQEACKAIGGKWENEHCLLNNLPKCIIADTDSCLVASAYGFREVDKVRVGISTTELKELVKCCREDVPPEPWSTGSPVQSCVDNPTNTDCLECTSPGPNSATCPTCGPGDGLPYWEFKGWTNCVDDSQNAIYQCNQGLVPGVSCETACGSGSKPNQSRVCDDGENECDPDDEDCVEPPPPETPPSNKCNVKGTSLTWDECSGKYQFDYNDQEQVVVTNLKEGFKGHAIGKCVNGSISFSEKKCEVCAGGGGCPGSCAVPSEYSWGSACKGPKKVTTLTIGNGKSVLYLNTTENWLGSTYGYCNNGNLTFDEGYCQEAKPCEMPASELKWAECGKSMVATTYLHGQGVIAMNTAPNWSGVKQGKCENGTIEWFNESCQEAKPCEQPAGDVTWGSGCSHSLGATTYSSGAMIVLQNQKENLRGVKQGKCENGAFDWFNVNCQESLSCEVPAGNVSWGTGCSNNVSATTYPDGSSIVIQNSESNFTGVKQGRCKNGTIEWFNVTCGDATPCPISGGTVSWGGNCSANVSAGTVSSGSGIIWQNSTTNYSGVKQGRCNNGTIDWFNESCYSSKPCTLSGGNVSWGADNKCSAPTPSMTLNHGQNKVISSTVEGWGGSYIYKCVDGEITAEALSCSCVGI